MHDPQSPTATAPPWTPPGYRAENFLGRSASGEVWRGRVAASGQSVALKRLAIDDPAAIRAARAEVALLATLDHPHLVPILDFAVVPDGLVVVSALAFGGSLAGLLLHRDRLTPGEVITALSPVASAVAHAHAAGVLHGKISPGNVLFTDIGLPWLADLGLPRVFGPGVGATDDRVCAAAYCDPQVAAGESLTAAADVFMLAGVALHALTGEPPWFGSGPGAAREVATLGGAAPDVTARDGAGLDVAARLRVAGCPTLVADVVARGLDPDPARRGSAAEFALELRHAGTPLPVVLTSAHPPIDTDAVADSVVGDAVAAAVVEADRLGGFDVTDPEPAPGTTPDSAVPPVSDPAASIIWTVIPGREEVIPPEGVIPDGGEDDRPGRAGDPLPPVPRRRSTSSARPTLRAALGVVAVMAGLGLLGFLLIGRGHPATTLATASGPRVTGAARSPATSPAATGPTASSSPTVSPAADRATPSATAGRVLAQLDAVRAQAYAFRSPGLLASVYANAALRSDDAAQLVRLVPSGCGLAGVTTQFRIVRVVSSRGGGLEVHAVASVGSATLRCNGLVSGRAPRTAEHAVVIDLVRVGSSLRIGAMHDA